MISLFADGIYQRCNRVDGSLINVLKFMGSFNAVLVPNIFAEVILAIHGFSKKKKKNS